MLKYIYVSINSLIYCGNKTVLKGKNAKQPKLKEFYLPKSQG